MDVLDYLHLEESFVSKIMSYPSVVISLRSTLVEKATGARFVVLAVGARACIFWRTAGAAADFGGLV